MAIRSVYLPGPQIQDQRIRISGDEHRHLAVARAELHESIEVFDGKGTAWGAVIESIGKHETIARVTESRKIPPDPFELTLALAMIRIAAFEFALEKVVEIGVTRIVPFSAERSNVSAGNRHERWLRLLIEATKQSKRYRIPVLEPPATFDHVISMPAESKIIFAEHGGGPLKSAVAGASILYLVGPEGGWTDRELSEARNKGFNAVSLGEGILKAETAAIVGTSLIRYELGR